jgi:hypothetical protein
MLFIAERGKARLNTIGRNRCERQFFNINGAVRIYEPSLQPEPGDERGKTESFHVLPLLEKTTDPQWNIF